MQPTLTNLEKLEIGNHYIIDFNDFINEDNELSFITIKDKLENTILIKFENGEEKWYSKNKKITLHDHIPVSFMRKHKLIKLDK